jgi:predicted metal-dependent hydrolase
MGKKVNTVDKLGLPAYTVRVSDRAKYLRLEVSSQKGLEVIVPKGYDHNQIPVVLQSKQAWIDKVLGMSEAKREFQKAQPVLATSQKVLVKIGKGIAKMSKICIK